MNIKFNKLANIADIDFSDNADLTLLIGDNGVGKTFLLEAYSKANDYIVEKYVATRYFNKIVKTLDIEIEPSDKLDENTKNIGNANSESQNNFIRASFELDINLSNIDKLEYEIKQSILETQNKLNGIIQNEIFFNGLKAEGFKLELNPCFDSLEKKASYIVEIEISPKEVLTISDGEDANPIEDRYSKITLRRKNSKDNVRQLSDQEEVVSIFNEIKSGEYNKIIPLVKYYISNQIRKEFVENNNLKNIVYIPSERVISMSASLERILNSENFIDMRYSEKKFMQQYSVVKEALTKLSNSSLQKLKFSKEYIDLVGGTPVFNEDGELSYIVDDYGRNINRSLFSTKQNKLFPFFILEGNYDRFLYNQNLWMLKRVVIIEEPEAHLSLKGITQIAEYICHLSEKRNVIISTHSDVLVSRINNIFIERQRNFKLNGYEIIEKSPLNIFRPIELTKYGLRSDFIEEQLNSLIIETDKIQSKIESAEGD